MVHLIDKAALVAEIKKRIKEAESNCGGYKSYDEHRCDACIVGFYEEFLEILDTIEVKEVDLDEKIKDYIYAIPHAKTGIPNGWRLSWHEENVIEIAKHFFELGLKAQKGE